MVLAKDIEWHWFLSTIPLLQWRYDNDVYIYIYIDLWTDISVQKKLDGDRTKQHFDTGSYPEYETFINHN